MLLLSLLATAFALSCVVITPAGYIFNLTSLYTEESYSKDSALNDDFFVNFCGPTVNCGNASCGCSPGGQGVCQYGANHNWYGCGTYATANYGDTKPHGKGIVVTYSNGQPCHSNPRTSVITVMCNPKVRPGLVYNKVVEELNCVYSISMESAAACPIGRRKAG